jgi:hypothetical protein
MWKYLHQIANHQVCLSSLLMTVIIFNMVLAENCFELNGFWVRALPGLMHLGLRIGPLCPMFCTKLEEPCSFSKVPDSRYASFPDILRVQKEDKASHSHKIWNEFSSSVPHFLQVGLLHSPVIYKCLLKVLCSVRRPITTLDCVLLKDSENCLISIRNLKLSEKTNIFIISH